MNESKLIDGIQEWKRVSQMMTEVFGPSVVEQRSYGQEQLRHYRQLIRENAGENSLQSRLMLSLVKDEVKKLEKQLYPSFLRRILQRVITVPGKQTITSVKQPAPEKINISDKADLLNTLKDNTRHLQNGNHLISKQRQRNEIKIKRR